MSMLKSLQFGLYALVMLLTAGQSYALDQTSRSGEDKCFLWEVRSDTATVYLMGSFHMFKQDMYPLDECFTDAFDKADILVVEVNMNNVDQEKMAELFKQRGIYQGDVTIEQRLSKETLDKLKEYLNSRGIDMTQVNRMKPWFLGMTIAVQEMISLGYDPNLGVDLYFMANLGDREIISLETIEEQLEILAGDPQDIQDLALRMELEDIPELESLMSRMIDAWSSGDAGALDEIMREPEDRYPGLEQQFKRTIDDRNILMAKKITHFLDTDKTYFVVVGGGHIGGEKGLLTLLANKGFSIHQLPKAERSIEEQQRSMSMNPVEMIAITR